MGSEWEASDEGGCGEVDVVVRRVEDFIREKIGNDVFSHSLSIVCAK
jgi:hypothetical protein